MKRNYIAFDDATVTANKPEMIVLADANFIRCVNSDGRRFMVSIDGQTAVPCWGGWHWAVGATERFSKLVVSLMPGDTEALKVEFMHGLGTFDDKQLQVVHDYAVASKIRLAIPTRSQSYTSQVAGGSNVLAKVFDADDAAQEIIIYYRTYCETSNAAVVGNVYQSIILSQDQATNQRLLTLPVIFIPTGDARRNEIREVRLKYAGQLWYSNIRHHGTGTNQPIYFTRLLL